MLHSGNTHRIIRYEGPRLLTLIAPNFGRIYFRNSWNLDLLAIECDTSFINGDDIIIDLEDGKLIQKANTFNFHAIPKELIEIYKNNGILNYVKRQLN